MSKTKKKSKTKYIIIAVFAIVIISAGIYLGLAAPFPVLSQPVNMTGIITIETYTAFVTFPNTQMQVIIELTSASAVWGYDVTDSGGNSIASDASLSTTPGTYGTGWLTVSPGTYNITIACVGSLSGTITVIARGAPFTSVII